MLNWRAELRAEGVERRPSNSNNADRGYVEQPGEGTADKPPSSVPRLPPHSQRPQSDAPLVLRRPVTSLTPAPPPPERETRITPHVPPPIERDDTRQIKAALEQIRTEAAPLPPASEKPTEAPSQNLVKLERPESSKPALQACGKRARRCHAFPDDFKSKVLARLEEVKAEPHRRGDGVRTEKVGREFDVSASLIQRWVRERGKQTEMPNKAKNQGKLSQYSQEERDEWARKAMTYGRGGGPLMAKKAKVPLGTMHGWLNSYRNRIAQEEATPTSTMVSSGPVSKPVASKPNGAHPPQLGGFLTGLDEYIAQLVDARVEAKLKEILSTKSLMELMKA